MVNLNAHFFQGGRFDLISGGCAAYDSWQELAARVREHQRIIEQMEQARHLYLSPVEGEALIMISVLSICTFH